MSGSNARNIRAIKADISQFAIVKPGQFRDIAPTIQERLDHTEEREQHDRLLAVEIQLLGEDYLSNFI